MGDRTFSRVINQRREELGLSQARVGELVGRSASTIRNWERGRSTPSAKADVATLAAVLGVEERELTELAGFETESVPVVAESHPTVEEVYASLSFDDHDGREDEAAPEAPAAFVGETEEPAESQEAPSEDGMQEPAAHLYEPEEPFPQADPQPPPATPPPNEPRPWIGAGSFDRVVADASEDPAEERSEALDRPPDDELTGGMVGDAGVPPAVEWGDGTRSDPFVDDSARRGRRLARAAPPTVLETAAPGEPSYLENPAERQRYRLRALLTTAIVVAMVVVLLWSFDRTTDALGSMWDRITDMLAI